MRLWWLVRHLLNEWGAPHQHPAAVAQLAVEGFDHAGAGFAHHVGRRGQHLRVNYDLEQFSGSCTRRGWGSSRDSCGADPSPREESQASSKPT